MKFVYLLVLSAILSFGMVDDDHLSAIYAFAIVLYGNYLVNDERASQRTTVKSVLLVLAYFVIYANLKHPAMLIFFHAALWYMPIWSVDYVEKKSGFVWDLDSSKPVPDTELLYGYGASYKAALNKSSKFREMREPFMSFPLEPGEERGAGKLRSALDVMGYQKVQGSFVDLGAGAGYFTKVMFDRGASSGEAVSRWSSNPRHRQLDVNVRRSNLTETHADITEYPARKVDWILFDAGESDHNYKPEEKRNFKLLSRTIIPWITINPKANFIIKVMCPWSDRTRDLLRTVQSITGKGKLIRLSGDRMSNCEMYFVSMIKDDDINAPVKEMMETLIDYWRRGIPANSGLPLQPMDPVWEPEPNIPGVPELPPLDMSASVAEVTRGVLREPRKITKFLVELGHFPSNPMGSAGTSRNYVVKELTDSLRHGMDLVDNWSMTSTTPLATYNIVKKKIDNAPVENHAHWPRIKSVWDAMGEFFKDSGHRLHQLSDEEIPAAINRHGGLGMQDADLVEMGIRDLGDFVDHDSGKTWRAKVKEFAKHLRKEKPIKGVFNSVGKREKKMDLTRSKAKGSRLIWFLSATARLFEAKVIGNLEEMLEKVLPYSVCGMPQYDYGNKIEDIFRRLPRAVAEDIAGFDTRVSKTMQRFECRFLEQISGDEQQKHYIRLLYRLYSNAHVMIDRNIEGKSETALYKLRGQVASGRRPTYGMNTLDNSVAQLAAMSYALGIPEQDVKAWALKVLRAGQSDDFSAVISGDDSVVFASEPSLQAFSTKGFVFLNEIGFVRKNTAYGEPSPIIRRFEDIDFCSNYYTRVLFKNDRGERAHKCLPIRGMDEIIGKALLAKGDYKDERTEIAWAREQGINMLLNYGAIPMARILGLAILSSTPCNLRLEGLSLGWSVHGRPWLTRQMDILDIINQCYFGSHTRYPIPGFYLTSLGGYHYIPLWQRRRFQIVRSKVYRKWQADLRQTVMMLKKPDRDLRYIDYLGYVSLFNEPFVL